MIADNKEIKKRIIELQAKLNITFPSLYIEFLAKINDGDLYEVENSGICLYSYSRFRGKK
ncbi:MAG: SMI1/KNR4 family protein [Phocaeicola sp.]